MCDRDEGGKKDIRCALATCGILLRDSGRANLLSLGLLLDVGYQQLELESLARHRVSADLSICLLRGYRDFFGLIDFHSHQSFLEARDDLVRTEHDLKRLVISRWI